MMTTLPSQLTSDRLTLGSMKAMGCSPRTTLSLWDLMMIIFDGNVMRMMMVIMMMMSLITS